MWEQIKMKLKHYWNILDVIVNVNSIVQHVIQMKNGIIINVNVSVKAIISAKDIMAGIQINIVVKIVSI